MIRSYSIILLATISISMSPSFLLAWSSSSAASKQGILGKKSTALDVLEELKRSNRLASYVPTQPDNDNTATTTVTTPATSGVAGVWTVKSLALAGMQVVLCARNVESAEKVVEENLPASCRSKVTVQQLDLSDMDSIQSASESIVTRFGSDGIDVLVNNAGVMAVPTRTETKQGLELQFGTNHVGHHMLTRLLLPSLNNNGRIVTVASEAHRFAPSRSSRQEWDAYQKEKYTPWRAYGISKLANVVSAKALQDQLEACGREDVSSVSLHPGVIRTNLWRHSNPLLKPLTRFFANKNVEQGAATNVYCALVSEVTGGAYYSDCNVATPTAMSEDMRLRNVLWELTEEIITKQGYTLPDMRATTTKIAQEAEPTTAKTV